MKGSCFWVHLALLKFSHEAFSEMAQCCSSTVTGLVSEVTLFTPKPEYGTDSITVLWDSVQPEMLWYGQYTAVCPLESCHREYEVSNLSISFADHEMSVQPSHWVSESYLSHQDRHVWISIGLLLHGLLLQKILWYHDRGHATIVYSLNCQILNLFTRTKCQTLSTENNHSHKCSKFCTPIIANDNDYLSTSKYT